MSFKLAEEIEAWFVSHDGDGAFMRVERTIPYTVIGPPKTGSCIVYATKPGLISAVMHEFPAAAEFGLVGRCGLPNRSDVAWLRDFAGERRLYFCGDMDPEDLMVFAWLRAMLSPVQVVHFGINDLLLETLGVSPVENNTIPLSKPEEAAFAMLPGAFSDLQQTVGSNCLQLLAAKRKMEVEAIVCDRGLTAKVFELMASSERE
jgi:hypothetical protein